MRDPRSGLVKRILLGASLLAAVPAITRGEMPAQEVSLRLGDYRYTPDTIEVQAGRPVALTLTNTDALMPHNFTLQDAAAGLAIDTDISAGTTAVVNFTAVKPGTYRFFCDKKLPFMKSHRERGMEGTLRVIPVAAD